MKTDFFKQYIELNKTLIKTMCIKSLTSCDSINDLLRLKYGASSVDDNNPYSWKYYLNISGNYHSTDTVITVTSFDTLEDIVFSKENLAIHIATAEAYAYGTKHYRNLVNKYINQESLIIGILYPCDINFAIESPDKTILSYPSYLVEPQESTLMYDLQNYIFNYCSRWNVNAFGISDSLYHTAQHAIMYLNLLPKLLNLRLARCKTNEAHSFHMTEYLASHGGLDMFIPYLTLKQQLYLYRNIRYIERNPGTTEQFNTLLEHLLTQRRIPITELVVKQIDSFDSDYYPNLIVNKKPINLGVTDQLQITLDELYTSEKTLGLDNSNYLDNNSLTITKVLKNSKSGTIRSKYLESDLTDYSGAIPDPIEVVMLRQLAYMTTHGLYTSIIDFKDPKTSVIYSLRALDAFLYIYYLTLRSIEIIPDHIPVYVNLKQRKNPKPSLAHLKSIVDNNRSELYPIIEELLLNQPDIVECKSVSSFYNLTETIYKEALYHWFLLSNTNDLYSRGYLQQVILHLYEDEVIDFNISGMTFDQWVESKNLPVYNLTYAEAQILISIIFTAVTGYTLDKSKDLSSIQNAMIGLMEQLSSYTIKFLKSINKDHIKNVILPAIRVGEVRLQNESIDYLDISVNVFGNISNTTSFSTNIESVSNKDYNYHYMSSKQLISYPVSSEIKSNIVIDNKENFTFNSFNISFMYNGYNTEVSDKSAFIGMEYFLALSDAEKAQLVSIY